MSMLERLGKMLGVRSDQVNDALQDEGRARSAVKLSRRGFFAAGATMAAAPLLPKRTYSFLFEQALPMGDYLHVHNWIAAVGVMPIFYTLLREGQGER